MGYTKNQLSWIALRLTLGWIFFWAFIDKLFGLGFTTCRNAETGVVTMLCDSAWLSGGSPTLGFLKFGSHGPLKPLYEAIAGHIVIDVLFMGALLLIGLTLLLGIGMRLGSYVGALLTFLMWTALILPEHNPLLDEHIVYMFAFLVIASTKSGQWFGLGKWWTQTKLVRRNRILE